MTVVEMVEIWFELITSVRRMRSENNITTILPYVIFDVAAEKIEELHLLDKSFTNMVKNLCKVNEVIFRENSDTPNIYFTQSSFKNIYDNTKWLAWGEDIIVMD